MKPNRTFFLICLSGLAAILLIFGFVRMKIGPFLPPQIDQNLPNAVIIGAIGIMLWNRKLRTEAQKAEAERKRIEIEAAAARQVEEESLEDGSHPGGADEPQGEGGAIGGADSADAGR